MTNAIITFSYNAFAPDVASRLRETANAIRDSERHQVLEILATGNALLDAKTVLLHGQFGRWLSAEFGWTERTAQNYMRAAEAFGSNPKRVSDFSVTTVYRLAAIPPCPRLQILDSGAKDENEIADLIAQHNLEAKKAAQQTKQSPERKAREKRHLAAGERRLAKWKAEEDARAQRQQQAADEAVNLVSELGPQKLAKLLQLVAGAGGFFPSKLRDRVERSSVPPSCGDAGQ